MIHTIRTITVGQDECVIDRPIMLYRGDRDLEVEFSLVGNSFMFGTDGNVLASMQAKYAQLVVNTPSGSNMFSDIVACRKGNVIFTIRGEMIDEIREVGMYAFQIRLLDATQTSRVTLPPVYNGIEIRQPIAAEDQENVTGDGVVDYAEMGRYTSESGPTFNSLGDYNKTAWQQRDIISTYRMNKIEDALYNINEHCRDTIDIHENQIAQLEANYNASFENVNKNINERIEYMQGEVNEAEAAMSAAKEEFLASVVTAEANLKIYVDGKMDEELNDIEYGLNTVSQKTNWINPDTFDGNDKEKLELAFTEARETFKTVVLSRYYDITGLGSVNIPKRINTRKTLYIQGIGGGIIKQDNGLFFTTTDEFSADITFSNVQFESRASAGAIVFDTPRLIVINTNNCTFTGVDHIFKSEREGYVQSYRSIGDRVIGGNGYFFDIPGAYDLRINNILCEQRDSFFLHRGEGVHSKLYNCSFNCCIVEGLTNQAFKISHVEATSFRDCYFESNGTYDIEISTGSIINGLTISGCRNGGRRTNVDYFIRIRGDIDGCIVENCVSQNLGIIDAYEVTDGFIDARNNSITVGADNNERYRGVDIYPTGKHEIIMTGSEERPIAINNTGYNVRYTVKATETMTVGGAGTFTYNVGTEVGRDDLISIQVIPTNANQMINVRSYWRDSTEKNYVKVALKNESTELPGEFEICVTVFKNQVSIFG